MKYQPHTGITLQPQSACAAVVRGMEGGRELDWWVDGWMEIDEEEKKKEEMGGD